jgi:predicted nucleic-acid-binding Zn-ribbon protein
MPSYDWNCPVCKHSVSAASAACHNCGCPAEVTGEEVERRRSIYAGPEFGAEPHEPLTDGTLASVNGRPYSCTKCQHNRCRVGEIRASGGFVSAVFEVQTERFSYVSCARCRHTEFFACEASVLGMVFDYFVG